MAETTPTTTATTSSSTPLLPTSSPPINPVDPNLQNPIHQRHVMPRAPETPSASDAFNLGVLSDSLSVVTSAPPMPGFAAMPYIGFRPPTSHPLIGVHITDYIKFQVNTAGANYSKWRQIIVSLLTMYKATDHITEGAAPAAPDDTWQAVDIHISMWFLSTLSDDLHRLVQGTDGRAGTTWTRLRRFFLDHGASRYLYLSKTFHNYPRGDLSVSDYASKLQGLADDLAAIRRPVDERDLTLAFLDGLSKSFKLKTEILKNVPILPSFSDACSRLQLAEVSDASDHQQEGAQVMVAQRGDRAPSAGTGGGGPSGISGN
jgi:hypothetical protein